MKKWMAVLAGVLFFIGGCATSHQPAAQEETGASQNGDSNAVFYTFPDIPVPKELTFQRGKSFIYETPNVKAGVLVLSGNVNVGDLETYFRINMVKNGWRFVNSYKYGNTILNFVKEDRTSSIKATRETFTTQVEIWVGPVDRAAQTWSTQQQNDFK